MGLHNYTRENLNGPAVGKDIGYMYATGGDVSTVEIGGNVFRQHVFYTAGTYEFEVWSPGTVDYCVVVGGGGAGSASTSAGGGGSGGDLRWAVDLFTANIGDVYTVTVGPGGLRAGATGGDGQPTSITFGETVLLLAAGGGGGTTAAPRAQNGTSTTISLPNIGGGNGGLGGIGTGDATCGGGGGAGGYSGNGGAGGAAGGANNGAAGTGGGGGGGGSGGSADVGGGGGGVGVLGEGDSGLGGTGSTSDAYQGGGGSNAFAGSTGGTSSRGPIAFTILFYNNGIEYPSDPRGQQGGWFGGGGGGDDNGSERGFGGQGGVMIRYQIG